MTQSIALRNCRFCVASGEPGTRGTRLAGDPAQESRVHAQPAPLYFAWSFPGFGHWPSGGTLGQPSCTGPQNARALAPWAGSQLSPCSSLRRAGRHILSFILSVVGRLALTGREAGSQLQGQWRWRDSRPALSPAACPGKFMCNTGRCIRNELRCDGWADCADYSDELQCREWGCPCCAWCLPAEPRWREGAPTPSAAI